jgi:RND family efflux transporter MFP subunit
MKKTYFLIAVSLMMTGCHNNKPIEQPAQAVQVQSVDGRHEASPGEVRFSAVVAPDSQVTMSFRINGYVTSLMKVRGVDGRMRELAEGDHVGQGSVLVRIRPSEYQDKVRQASSQAEAAQAAAEKARLDFDRATRLYESKSLTKPEFDAAKAQYDSTQAQLNAAHAQTSEARIALGDTSLIAPFNGEIIKKSTELGAFVGPGVPAFTVANTDIVKIVVGVPDTVVRSVKLNQPVAISVDAFPDRTFSAHISRIASAADPVTRNFDVELEIPNHEHLLKAGMIGSLQLARPETEPEQQASLTVPISAIVQSPDGKYGVFLVSKSGGGDVARLRTVEIGDVSGSDITVHNGLKTGDRVITTGANLIKDGQRVEVLN